MKLFSKMISDRSKKGFTLVEMLIVIAVLAILMAVAVPNAASYVKRIKLMELDDSARSIFMAVQNKMTVMKQAGESLTPAESKTYDGGNYPEIFNPAPDPATPAPDGTDYLESEPRYLINSKGTENAFVKLSTIEGQLYNHNYVIEYDATTGRVFGVFYSEEVDLTLNPNKYPEDYKTLESRDFETRLQADKLVGYYGGVGDLMKVPTGGEVDVPQLGIGDSEKLVVHVSMPTDYTKDKLYFSLSISSASDPSKSVTIVPYNSGSLDNYYIKKNKSATIILDSLAPGCCADQGKWFLPDYNKDLSDYVLERDFKGWVFKGGSYTNGQPFDPYSNGLSSWNDRTQYTWKVDDYVINPGSDININVLFYDETGTQLETKLESKVNSYFKNLNGGNADISAGRHLQNLANYVDSGLVSGGKLIKTIDFSQDNHDYDSWNADITYKGTPGHPDLYNFKPIAGRYVGDSKFLPNFDGSADQGYELKYIRIDTVGEYAENTGFFTELYNSSNVSNVKFFCPVVLGDGEYTGLFFGSCRGGTNVKNFTVVNPIIESSGKYVGGLFGEITGGGEISGHKIYVEEVTDYFDNYESDYRNRGIKGNITWGNPKNDPYARFRVRGLSEDTYAGGLLGHCTGHIKESAAAIRIESKGYAGGLVGLAEGSIIKCHVGGHTYNGSFVVPKGTVCGGITLTEDYYLINIKGEKASGGLAAESQNAPTGCYTTCSVGYYPGGMADTFIAICGSKSGSEKAYAIGSLIGVDNHKVIEQGTAWNNLYQSLSTLLEAQDANVGTCQAHKKYDASLTEPYPYYVSSNTDFKVDGTACHLGDWPYYQSSVKGFGLFYWEKENNEYKVKACYLDNNDVFQTVSTLCTEMDGKGVTDYGYGYFFNRDIAVESGTSGLIGQGINKGTSHYPSVAAALKEAGLSGVECVIAETNQNSNTHGDQTFTFKGKYSDGTTINQSLVYNPDFCAIGKSSIDYYELRSIAQLRRLAGCVGQNTFDNSAYMGKNYELSHDIQFGSDSIKPIGLATKFTGKFDGHCYRLIDAKLDMNNVNTNSVGIFGCIKNATINGVVVFNGNYSINNLQNDAAVGGIVGRAEGTSTITNCAFTGGIDASSNGSIAAGGIVGIAGNGENTVTVSNCQAVFDNYSGMSVTGNGGIVTAGGIVGTINSNIPISNCYSGGNITATGSQTYVGGIFGGNSNTVESIKNCYTYYVPNNADAHPIGEKSGVAEVYYSNCYYLRRVNISDVGNVNIVECVDKGDLDDKTQTLLPLGGFSSDAIAYLESLDTPYTYAYPAVISEGEQFYHYGPSPFGEDPVTLGDKRLGVFYWEQEGSEYHLKVCYYDKIGGSYQYQGSKDNLCKNVDGNRITQSGYGYFIGNGIKDGSAQGFTDNTLDDIMLSTDIDITSALAKCLKESEDDAITAEEVAKNFTIKCYDYTNSRDVESRKVSIKSEDVNYDFNIVPGLCAADKSDSTLKYEIRTAQHLKNLSAVTYKNKDFKQTHDIIFTDGNTVTPIGDSTSPFKGRYDGGRYRIHNLKVQSGSDNVGLFGYTNGATIEDTFVIEGNVSYTGDGNANIGGLVGSADNTRIENSIYTGAINARVSADKTTNIGGIVGSFNGNNKIERCEATADITVSGKAAVIVGGIAGTVNSNIENCYSGGSLTWNNEPKSAYVGGIVGKGNGTISVDMCYTHMHIPGAIDNVTVHPIGNDVNTTDCHYIESKNHYANAFDTNVHSGITKHVDFSIAAMSGFGTVGKTYPTGLTAGNANPYPLPAVVRDGSNYVHYGKWNPEVETLSPGTYGVFYWEEETDKDTNSKEYHVRVCSVKDGIICPVQDNLCKDMDGNTITSYGYGYFYDKAIPIDDIEIEYTVDYNKDPKITEGIRATFEELDFSGIDLKWSYGAINTHKDRTIQLSYAGKPLTVTSEKLPVNVEFNLDFCYLKMWAGDSKPADEVYKYEVRNAEQLQHIGMTTQNGEDTVEYFYLDSNFTCRQMHDIVYTDIPTYDPIGDKAHPFAGTYNGNGYRIIDLKYSSNIEHDVNYIGLFGCVEGTTTAGTTKFAVIENVTMFNAKINVGSLTYDEDNFYMGAIGGIVGYARNTTINNCAFYGNINAGINYSSIYQRLRYAVGGIVGYGYEDTNITNCESILSAKWKDSLFTLYYHISEGGIAGIIDNGNILNCYSGGNIEADLGGIGKFGRAYATGGGIVGTGNVNINNCYSFMNISDEIERANPIGNNFEHRPPNTRYSATYEVDISDCFCLTGDNFYDPSFTGADGITVKKNIVDLAKALKTILPDSSRYNVEAYTTDLDNPGIYPLAAVVKDNKTGKYVHYGDAAGMIQYKAIVNTTAGTGRGTVSPETLQAAPGANVEFTVTPEPNSTVKSVTVKDKDGNDVTCTNNNGTYSFKMQKGGVTVIVNFKSNLNTINAKVNDRNGGTLSTEPYPQAKKDDVVTFTANPKSGWQCTGVTAVDSSNVPIAVTYTEGKTKGSFTMPDDDVTVTASFAKILYNIDTHNIQHGSIDTYTEGKAGVGDNVTLIINPESGWKCTVVKVDGKSLDYKSGDQYVNFVMPANDVTVTAEFVRVGEIPAGSFAITVNATPTEYGTVSCVDYAQGGNQVTVNITPLEGYQGNSISIIDQWNNPVQYSSVDDNTIKFTMPQCSATINVEFAEKLNLGSKVGLFVAERVNNWANIKIVSNFPDEVDAKPNGNIDFYGILVDNSIDINKVSAEIVSANNSSPTRVTLTPYENKDITVNYDEFGEYNLYKISGYYINYDSNNMERIILRIDNVKVFDIGVTRSNW